ncbi:MAG: hypothetical protein JWN42_1034 [Candidatus Angelobacter sp.]|nr:hypothetical protein [Candidatus Angelobacter sp.]
MTTITTAWTLAKTAGEVGKKLFELTKDVKDRELKQHIDEILDTLRVLSLNSALVAMTPGVPAHSAAMVRAFGYGIHHAVFEAVTQCANPRKGE